MRLKRYLILATIFVHFLMFSGTKGCDSPLKGCPSDKIAFYLYINENQEAYELVLNATNTIAEAPFQPERNVKFIIHGYSGSKDNPRITALRDEYLKQQKWNIIVADFPKLAETGCYVQTTFPSVPGIGKCSADLINLILEYKPEITLENFHIIGFSIGAQVAAQLSINLKPEELPYITGLDPAWPLFYPVLSTRSGRLNKYHAKFVEVIHTNAGGFGVLYSDAHYDIYANDGTFQPGCGVDISCSHGRAIELFTESVNGQTQFIAYKCSHWDWTIKRDCSVDNSTYIVAGEHSVPPENSEQDGIYVFHTNSSPPYAMGNPKK